MRTSAFLVRVPHAHYRTFGVQCVAMRDSMMLWCGAVPDDTGENEAPPPGDTDTDAHAAAEAGAEARAPTDMAGAATEPASERACAAPAGRLGRDWSVAMTRPAAGTRASTTGTCLYRVDGEAALPMAQRLGTSLC